MQSLQEPFRTLIAAAVLAPSGDNMQPWRFEVDESESSLTVCVDEMRDTSPFNAGQGMARIACGAAIENIFQTAAHNKWEIAIRPNDGATRVAVLHVAPGLTSQRGHIPESIKRRHTNRRPYTGSNLTESVVRQWKEVARAENDFQVIWVTQRTLIRKLAQAIGRADAEIFGRRSFLRAFLSTVRFDLPDTAAAEEGLCTGTLELRASERRVLPMLRYAPGVFLSSWPMRRSFQMQAEKLVNSASGICMVVPRKAACATNYTVGRLMQRVWLYLTEAGYQVQPMMSIPVLVNANDHENGPARSMSDILGSSIDAFSDLADRLPAAIFRFGEGPVASARTGRRLFCFTGSATFRGWKFATGWSPFNGQGWLT